MLRVTRKTQVLALMASLLFANSIVKADERRGDREKVEKVLEQAGKIRETMTVPKNSHPLEGQEAARKTMEQFQTPDFQEKLRCQRESIQGENQKQEQTSVTQGKGTLSDQESVYLFLSSSMPEAMVNRYLIDVSRTGEQRIVPVLLGLPQGLAGKRVNADYFSRVMQADLGCRDTPEAHCQRLEVPLKINPELFTRYNITEVPALVYDNGQDSWSIHGEVELAYLLEKVGKAANSPALAGISIRLRGNQ
ncbi:MAG: TrbC family F-type conjugative pilus assembly protein [Desulfobulbus sp.]|nr:TrbC family F-type conjugative pilus assembly protein [Desulfobulbus sp.]